MVSAASWWWCARAGFSVVSAGATVGSVWVGTAAGGCGGAARMAAAGAAAGATSGLAGGAAAAGGGVAATVPAEVRCPPRNASTRASTTATAPATPSPSLAPALRPPAGASPRWGRSSSNVPTGGDTEIAVFEWRASAFDSLSRGYFSDACGATKTFDGSKGTPPAAPSA